jgi:alpha-galactosidase
MTSTSGAGGARSGASLWQAKRWRRTNQFLRREQVLIRRMQPLEKVVLVGAGSALFTKGLVADLVGRDEACELALVDIAPEALEVAERLARKMIETRKSPVRVTAALDRREVLKDATLVICTIAVGGAKASEQDGVIPRKYGIYQTIADSVMPGGTARALRTIPQMVAIAEDVCDLAPNALFFNYANPMIAICRAVRKATDAQIVGLCTGVDSTARGLATTLGAILDDVRYTAAGVNHLTWFTHFRINGEDAMPRLRQVAAEKLAPLAAFDQGALEVGRDVLEGSPFSWRLFELFGAYPAPGDRHVIEFFPQLFRGGKYYGKTLGIDIYNFESWVVFCQEMADQMRQEAFLNGPLPDDYFQRIGGERSMAFGILDSMRRDLGQVYSANVPNRGQIPNLPEDAVIECPAIADGSGLRPMLLDALPSGITGLLATRLAWVEATVEAALEGSRDKFIQALLLDGAVDSLATASALADDFLSAQAELLPQFQARV